MATHAVPQDVEADDKLIGFLSLKQFIFTVIGLGFGYLTFFFFTKVHPLAAIAWLPFTIVFLVLGLYQRKDQPAEVFLVSALGFYLKPKKRIWSQDGYEERVSIIAPPVVEKHYTKDFTGEEARGRLSNLSLMMDSRGWASKRVTDWQNPQMASVAAQSDRIVTPTEVASAQVPDPVQFSQPADPYDDRSLVGQQFETKIDAADSATHQQAIQGMQQAFQQASSSSSDTPPTTPTQPLNNPVITENTPIVAAPSVTTEDSIKPSELKPKTSKAEQTDKLDIPHETEDGSIEIQLH